MKREPVRECVESFGRTFEVTEAGKLTSHRSAIRNSRASRATTAKYVARS
jgi:hypothetical protein